MKNDAVNADKITPYEHFSRQKPSVGALRKHIQSDALPELEELYRLLQRSFTFFEILARDCAKNSPDFDDFEQAIVYSHQVLVAANKFGFPELGDSASDVYEHLKDFLDFPQSKAAYLAIGPLLERHLLIVSKVANSCKIGATGEFTPHSENSYNILIVDDDFVARELIKTSLSDDGYEIGEAECGFEALEILENVQPNLIILDVGLPDLSGFSVLKMIKDWPEKADIPVIMLTGKDGVEDYVIGLSRGAIDYITKPISLPDLEKRVADVLNNKRMRQYAE